MYLRFVVGSESENSAWLNGIFTESNQLLKAEELSAHEMKHMEATFAWFNEHLPCPPFSRKLRTGEWSREAVAWFRPEAKTMIAPVWDLVAIVQEHGIWVRRITSKKPGRIVYQDDFQVVAETPYWA